MAALFRSVDDGSSWSIPPPPKSYVPSSSSSSSSSSPAIDYGDGSYVLRDGWIYQRGDFYDTPIRQAPLDGGGLPGVSVLQDGRSLFDLGNIATGGAKLSDPIDGIGSFLASLGFGGPATVYAGPDSGGPTTNPAAYAWLAGNGIDVRIASFSESGRAPDPTGRLGNTIEGYQGGHAIGAPVYTVADDDPGNYFLAAILGAATFGAAAAFSAPASVAIRAAAPAGTGALGLGAGYTVPGSGLYGGLTTAQLGTLSAGLDAGLTVAAAQTAAGFSSALPYAAPAAIDAAPAGLAPAAAGVAPGAGGPTLQSLFSTISQAITGTAGVIGAGQSIVGALTGRPVVGQAAQEPATHAGAQTAAAAQTRSLLLLAAGATALVLILRK